MALVDKILKENDEMAGWESYLRTGKLPKRARPATNQKLASELLKSIPGDIIKMNTLELIVLSQPGYVGRNMDISFNCIESKNKAAVLGGDRKKASATIKIKAVDVFKKIGKITPKELKIILGQKDSVDTNIKQKQSENKDAIQYDYSVGKYGVKMLDDKIAYEGDMVLVNFSNGVFPMKVVRVAGNKTGEVMLIDPRKPAGSKSRGISPSLILKKQ